jgi:predicted DNA-binding protein (MmcQ/YjbR family)
MDIERLRDFCLSLPLATECFPFDETTLVFKVEGRIFLFTSLETADLRFNVKCNPDYALELRDAYAEVTPGFHCNKKYWNTVHVTRLFLLLIQF